MSTKNFTLRVLALLVPIALSTLAAADNSDILQRYKQTCTTGYRPVDGPRFRTALEKNPRVVGHFYSYLDGSDIWPCRQVAKIVNSILDKEDLEREDERMKALETANRIERDKKAREAAEKLISVIAELRHHRQVCTDVPRSLAFETARAALINETKANKDYNAAYDNDDADWWPKYLVDQYGKGPWCRKVTDIITKRERRDNE